MIEISLQNEFKQQAAEISITPGSQSVQSGWYVVYTQPKREHIAAVNLAQQGFEIYFPQYKTFKVSLAGSHAVFEPMFPRYVFFRPSHIGQSISSARSTRGVSFVLSFGSHVAVLKSELLQGIRVYESERNQADVSEISRFQPGLRVRLRECGLHGLEGLVQSVSAKRVTILIALLGTQSLVQVEHHQLELA